MLAQVTFVSAAQGLI